MSIVKRAVKDSKDVARLAVDAAKNELIEQLAPTIKSIIDGQLRAGVLGEDVDRLRRAADGHGETEFEEGKNMSKDNEDKFESVAALFPAVNEVADDTVDEAADELDEEFEEVAEAKDEENMDEEFELSEQELEEMYAEALQLEVDVKNGFSDMQKPHEFGAGAKGQYQSDPANLIDYGSGEKDWDDVEPPAKQDFTVKEIRALVRRGMAENKALAEENIRLTGMVQKLYGKLKEQNLLNAKILHVNKFLQGHRLTAEQKRTVIESLDEGKTVKEVKRIFGILENSFKAAGTISEGRRKPHADSQKRRTTGAPDTRVLRESADRAGGSGYNRWQQLAGLKKIVG